MGTPQSRLGAVGTWPSRNGFFREVDRCFDVTSADRRLACQRLDFGQIGCPLKDDLKQLVFVGTGGLVVASFEGKLTTKHDDQQTAFGEMFQREDPALGFGAGCFYIDVFGH